jgi:hypothetical protein
VRERLRDLVVNHEIVADLFGDETVGAGARGRVHHSSPTSLAVHNGIGSSHPHNPFRREALDNNTVYAGHLYRQGWQSHTRTGDPDRLVVGSGSLGGQKPIGRPPASPPPPGAPTRPLHRRPYGSKGVSSALALSATIARA